MILQCFVNQENTKKILNCHSISNEFIMKLLQQFREASRFLRQEEKKNKTSTFTKQFHKSISSMITCSRIRTLLSWVLFMERMEGGRRLVCLVEGKFAFNLSQWVIAQTLPFKNFFQFDKTQSFLWFFYDFSWKDLRNLKIFCLSSSGIIEWERLCLFKSNNIETIFKNYYLLLFFFFIFYCTDISDLGFGEIVF